MVGIPASWFEAHGLNAPDPKAFLSDLAPFDRLRDGELSRLATTVSPADYAPGQTVFDRWAIAEYLFVVIEGLVEEMDSLGPVGRFAAGEAFDSRALIEGRSQHRFVAKGQCVCYLLPVPLVLTFIRTNRAFRDFFHDDMARRLEAFVQVQQQREAASLLTARIGEHGFASPVFADAATSIQDAVGADEAARDIRDPGAQRRADRHLHRPRRPRAVDADGASRFHADRRTGQLRPDHAGARRPAVQRVRDHDEACHSPCGGDRRRADRGRARAGRSVEPDVQYVAFHRPPGGPGGIAGRSQGGGEPASPLRPLALRSRRQAALHRAAGDRSQPQDHGPPVRDGCARLPSRRCLPDGHGQRGARGATDPHGPGQRPDLSRRHAARRLRAGHRGVPGGDDGARLSALSRQRHGVEPGLGQVARRLWRGSSPLDPPAERARLHGHGDLSSTPARWPATATCSTSSRPICFS